MARLSAADFKYIYLYDFYVSTTKWNIFALNSIQSRVSVGKLWAG